MSKLTKKMIGAGAAAAALVSMSAPAQARDAHYKKDKVSAGEVIAGVAILGGIAAVLASNGKKDRYDDRYYDRNDRRYDGYGHNRNRKYSKRAAINKCIRNVERRSSRYNRSKVTDVAQVKRTRYGYKVKGKLVVRDRYNNRGRDSRHIGYNGYDRGYDKGRFTCYVENGRVVDVRYKGLGNWR